MSEFYGRTQGGRSEATRCGTSGSGIRSTVETWQSVIRSAFRTQLRGGCMSLLRVPARDLRPGDVALGSKQRILSCRNGGTGKVCLTLERMSGRNAGTLRVAEWHRGTIIGIHRPERCPHCGGTAVRPGTVGAGCAHCEHGRTPPPFAVSSGSAP